jgi:hypothetical protein
MRWSRQFMTDVYFLDYDAKSATYGNQFARKQRRMVGGRYFNRLPGEPPRAGFDYNVETGFQWAPSGIVEFAPWAQEGISG